MTAELTTHDTSIADESRDYELDEDTSETSDGNAGQLANLIKLTKTVHEESGYLLVWKLVHPQQPELDIKLFATPEQVEELITANHVPSTMVIPLTVLPGNMDLEMGYVSANVTFYSLIITNIYEGVQTGA